MQVLSGKPRADLRLAGPTPCPVLPLQGRKRQGACLESQCLKGPVKRDADRWIPEGKDRGEASSRGRSVLEKVFERGLQLMSSISSQALGSCVQRTGGTRLVFPTWRQASARAWGQNVQEVYDYTADQYREPVTRRDEGRLGPLPGTGWKGEPL